MIKKLTSMTNKDLNQIFSNPTHLISYLKTTFALKNLYDMRVRHYIIERHTLLVLNQFELYFSASFNTSFCNINLYRFFLALHDIGKPIAFAKGDKADQYKHTVQIMRDMKGKVPFTNDEIELTCALAGDDPLGLYFQDKLDIALTITRLKSLAGESGIDETQFFRLMLMYYQCDTASYTKDAGGTPFLERLFVYCNGKKVFNTEKLRLEFSHKYEDKLSLIEFQFG